MSVFLQTFLRVELRALMALLICACLVAVYGFADSLRASASGLSPLLSPLDAALGGFVYTIFFGLLPVIFYGAPVYAFLSYKRVAFWFAILLVSIAPGAAMFLTGERGMAVWFMIGGATVAFLTHFLTLWASKSR